MPNSPNEIAVPPVAAPERPGWCCLRCFSLRGISTAQASVPVSGADVSAAAAAGAADSATRATVAAAVPTGATGLAWGLGGLLAREVALGHVALVDPDLHADAAEGRAGLEEAVVDVRAERVQRHPTLAVELRAAHLRAAEAAR